ncbi:ABC transporter permease [Stenotrophomonas sp. MYb57]|uniref:MlaE family ABC transporter permease n=1 Tax=Stenotrophomonas sp. MYb57 TaxID=1827305 RepID=UPI0018F8A797|nr:ABC transporter permease [Stenotrophomonas sp. MYb57]
MTEAWLRRSAKALGPAAWTAGGDWTIEHYGKLSKMVASLRVENSGQSAISILDWANIRRLDTAGAALLVEMLGADLVRTHVGSDEGLSPERRALLETLADAAEAQQISTPENAESIPALRRGLERVGAMAERGFNSFLGLAGFVGQILETWLAIVPYPRRWRLTAVVAQIQRVAVDAIPIVALLSFMVGTVVAFLGATVLANFGASIFAVHLVAFAFMREFGVLLPAILIAGRTASSYTAQLGSMKANEEIDALRSGGLNPIELLVLPRVLALLISLPLLSLVGVLAGIAGGAAVCVFSLDISLSQFLAIVQDKIEVQHFLVGLSKAPFFAVMIAAIGCHEGFKVAGSAQSVGDHTTSSVVQSIFVVILLDALAALFFMEMKW